MVSIITSHSALYQTAIVYDAHGCPPFSPNANLDVLKRYHASGVTFLSLNVGFGAMTSSEIFSLIERFKAFIASHPQEYQFIQSAHDIYACKNTGKLGIAFDLEGADALEGELSLLDTYYQLGVRQLLIAYNQNNMAGGGCQGKEYRLTTFGKAIIKHMNTIGMIIDCSHTGYKTTLDIMEISTHPVVFSHANPAGLCDHPRNISDEQIKACAQTGGVIGINGIGIFLGENNTSTSRIVEHIDYIAQLVGVQHVGIGLDYVFDHEEVKALVKKNPKMFPAENGYEHVEIATPEQFPEICTALQQRGYAEDDIRGILGNNFLRIAQQVWQ